MPLFDQSAAYDFEVSFPGGREWFRNTLDAQVYAGEQSERRAGKFFVYDHSWENGEIATHIYQNGRVVR